ncbi:hypothetical protein SBP18_12185 [Rhodoferax ferrireducens]|uniref:hypothetical protein n=1 Tax=Rhodoferax ferrireducens TaxID=192843 RepID=UPI00298D6C8F|nr:hypothetical protein [Rhodoferax ferrireducens]WPC65265.1 hypothetical protein SBP18_12185 [Rhodoferax ferrireducens]
MYDNKRAMGEVIVIVELQLELEGQYKIRDLKPAADWLKKRMEYERDFGIGTPDEQLEWFDFLLTIRKAGFAGEIHAIGAMMFCAWIGDTKNPYATVYRAGFADGEHQGLSSAKKMADREIQKSVAKAAHGRRLIGATSRAKVKKEAESFRHLSKEKAATGMAGIVNLDTGTIRRYLSELYPGKKWKQ